MSRSPGRRRAGRRWRLATVQDFAALEFDGEISRFTQGGVEAKGSDYVGTDDAAGERLAHETDHPPSLAERSLCRHTPEVGEAMGRGGGGCGTFIVHTN